jgi:hypothetical protein
MKLLPKNKKGAIVTDTVTGVGFLIVTVIIILVIVSTLLGSNLFTKESVTIRNETGAYINGSGYTLAGVTDTGASSYVILQAINNSGTLIIPSGNYTVSALGVLTNATAFNSNSVNISYSYTRNSQSERSSNGMSGNFSAGIDDISEKIPTILLIVAVVFLFGALVLLVSRAKQMGIGGGGSL